MLVLLVWCTATLWGLVLFLDLGRIDYDVKSEGYYAVVYEVVDEGLVVLGCECDGDVDFLVRVESCIVVEVPVDRHVVDRRWRGWLILCVSERPITIGQFRCCYGVGFACEVE